MEGLSVSWFRHSANQCNYSGYILITTALYPQGLHIHTLNIQVYKACWRLTVSKDCWPHSKWRKPGAPLCCIQICYLQHLALSYIWENMKTVKNSSFVQRGKAYISKDTKLWMEIIKLHHGQWKTLELISYNYWWPGSTQKINDYISGCDKCQ